MKHRILKGGKRFGLLTAQHLAAVLAAVCVAVLLSNVYFQVNGISASYGYMLYPWNGQNVYEKSPAFDNVFDTSVKDIIMMAVIRTQMETDGVFDGKKKIDIAEYVNRKNGENKEAISAEYYLEDLIKWSGYGFETKDLEDKKSEESFLRYRMQQQKAGKEKRSIIIDVDSTEITEEKAVIMAEEKADVMTEAEAVASKEAVASEETLEEGKLYRTVLDERYFTVDGKSIVDYVTSWEEYDEFVGILMSASKQLAYNYNIYKQFQNFYDSSQSNMRYCLMIPAEGGYQYFSNLDNLPKNIEEMSTADVTGLFRRYGVYMYYYPKHMEYETNTGLEEWEVRECLTEYSYVYPEDCRIWIAVDTTYPVEDGILLGKMQYDSFMPYYIMWLIGAAAAFIVYFVLFIWITLLEGKGEEKEHILKLVDYIPAEVMLVLAGAAGLVWGFVLVELMNYITLFMTKQGRAIEILTIMGLAFSLIFMFFYLSLVRRLRAHVFWRHTVIGWLFLKLWHLTKRLWQKIKKASNSIYNDRSVAVRSLVPYLLFMAVNLVCLFLLLTGFWVIGLLGAAAFDVAVGIVIFRIAKTRVTIIDGIRTIKDGNISYQVDTNGMYGDNLELAGAVNSIGEGLRVAVETSMKDERLKADLITNVSHDIKTPLTSIINYVDLIKREDIQDEKIRGYVEVLDAKSQRLKQLTEDLVEASKISSGNIVYQFEKINFVELIHQTIGEFSEKFEEKQLQIVSRLPEEPIPIQADSRRIWRVVENLYNNIYKYAMPGTRVYMDMETFVEEECGMVSFSIKNISAQPLNINADELTERFIRGDVSRSTEGSGLGLSIAKNLTVAQHGDFTIYLDGDLFKVILKFPIYR